MKKISTRIRVWDKGKVGNELKIWKELPILSKKYGRKFVWIDGKITDFRTGLSMTLNEVKQVKNINFETLEKCIKNAILNNSIRYLSNVDVWKNKGVDLNEIRNY